MNVFRQGKSKHPFANLLNSELGRVVEWLHVSKLSLNVNKTGTVYFLKIDVGIIWSWCKQDGMRIKRVAVRKFIGVMEYEFLIGINISK